MDQNEPDLERMLTPAEVCVLLGVTNTALQDWRTAGTGPAYVRLGHRTVRYRQADIDTWLEQRAGGRADG
jgi:excisionase family DNA binding protein